MKKRTDKQSGFTLIELVIAFGVSAIIIAAASFSIFHLMNMTTRNTNYMTAVRNAQNAGYWITRDTEMAYGTILPDGNPGIFTNLSEESGFPLELRRIDSDNLEGPTVLTIYTLVDGTLWREYDGQSSIVAQHINANDTNVIYENGILEFTVVTKVTTKNITGTEKRTYQALPRSGLD